MSERDAATLIEVAPLTHDTRRFRLTRPEGFDFAPGQACEIAIDAADWRDEARPFTMVSAPSERDHLDFVIKIYEDHDGVTKRLDRLAPGAGLLLGAPFGAISDKGAGAFLAAGAGITPFIPILRARAREGALGGCRLIFANKAERDIILRAEWEAMAGLETVFVTEDAGDGLPTGHVDKGFLAGRLDTGAMLYICGPQGFVDTVRDAAQAMGMARGRIVTEEGW